MLRGEPDEVLTRLGVQRVLIQAQLGMLGNTAMWLAAAMIPFTLGQLILLRMQVPAWHRPELEALLGPVRFGLYHAAFDGAFLAGVGLTLVQLLISARTPHVDTAVMSKGRRAPMSLSKADALV